MEQEVEVKMAEEKKTGIISVQAKTGGLKFEGDNNWYNPNNEVKEIILGLSLRGKKMELTMNDGKITAIAELSSDDGGSEITEETIETAIPELKPPISEEGKKILERAKQGLGEGKTNRNNKNINSDFIVKISGKEFITANGLLEIAEQEGGIQSIEVTDINVTPDQTSAYVMVKVTMKDGRVFVDCGSGTPKNLGSKVQGYPVEMATTRARSRALRFGLNVDYCSVEEMT